jgi:DNA-binding GntR family transcriptional regulator
VSSGSNTSDWPPRKRGGGVLGVPVAAPNTAQPREAVSTRADAVYEVIHSALMKGEYSTGTRLVEGTLAAYMGVSRTPVREALRRLEGDGLIRSTGSSRGYIVEDLLADAEHVFMIRERLEGLGAMLAAQSITSAELRSLRDLQAKMEALLDQPHDVREEMAEFNASFHMRILRAARSPRLEGMVTRLHPEYLSYQVVLSYDSDGLTRSIEEHRAIADALWNRDADLADRLVQAHFEHGKTVVMQQLEQRQQGTVQAE